MVHTRLDRAAVSQASKVAEVFMVVLMVAAIVGVYLASSQGGGGGGENVGTEVRHLILSQTGEGNVGTKVGQVAPNFVDEDDNSFSLKGHRGKVVLLDFMAAWCGPCKMEMSYLREINESYSGEDVVIMSIDVDPTEDDDTIRGLKKDYGGDWIFASGPSVGVEYRAFSIPALYIIDQQGIITYKNVGVTSSSTLSSEIDKLL
jgi:thiol-disulfide isomerase/thioredoxin